MAITTAPAIVPGFYNPRTTGIYGAAISSNSLSRFWRSMLYSASFPGAYTALTPGLSGATIAGTSSTACIRHSNAPSGTTYLLEAQAWMHGASLGNYVLQPHYCSIWLVDRLWHNSGIVVTTTGAQTINSVTLPARDLNASTNGDGVYAALEASVSTNTLNTNINISYTNSAGTAGRTGTIEDWPATSGTGRFAVFSLQAGDVGVRSIETITLGTSLGAGTVHLVLFRPLCILPAGKAAASSGGRAYDALRLGLPQIFDDTALWPLIQSGASSNACNLELRTVLTHG